MSKKYTLLTFKGICMNFLLELNFFILSHPVTCKQPHKIVQIHMGHPVHTYKISLFFLMGSQASQSMIFLIKSLTAKPTKN